MQHARFQAIRSTLLRFLTGLLIGIASIWGSTSLWAEDSLGDSAGAAADRDTRSEVQPSGPDAKLAIQRIRGAIDRSPTESPAQVVVAYFTARDRAPAKDHHQRIGRIVKETAEFYESELRRYGFDDCQMNLFDGGRVIDVIGKDTDREYGKADGYRIRNEVIPVLREQGIDPAKSVLLIFCNLMDYDAGTPGATSPSISHRSPYYGGGGHLSGNAWQCDSEILDTLRFQDPTLILDGEYGKISIGRHNSIFIGGVVHELGHALSLPHCRETPAESVRGTALMGSGNRTFREELRGEGRGTFLTFAHALRLAAHPAFRTRVVSTVTERAEMRWDGLTVSTGPGGKMIIRGSVQSSIPVHGVVAYFDPAGRSDYDSMTAWAIPDSDGGFEIESPSLTACEYAELRLVACHVNGSTTQKRMAYRVEPSGNVDVSTIRMELELGPMIDLIRADRLDDAEQELSRIAGADQELRKIGTRLLTRFRHASTPASVDAAELDPSIRSVALSAVKPDSASVGWLRPTYDSVPDPSRLLSVDGDYFRSGIYAHAAAKHVYTVAAKWKRLSGRCGLQQGHPGKVDFRIIGDDVVLWQSVGVDQGKSPKFDVDISGVRTLTLVVDDGGNGKGADWGVWIEPSLSR